MRNTIWVLTVASLRLIGSSGKRWRPGKRVAAGVVVVVRKEVSQVNRKWGPIQSLGIQVAESGSILQAKGNH